MALTDSRPDSKKVSDLDTPETDPTLGRRRFLTWGIYGVGAAVAVALAVPAVGYFVAPALSGSTDLQIPVGNLSDYANQTTPKQVNVDYNYKDDFKIVNGTTTVFVQAKKAGATNPEDFRVLSPTCTHLGCQVGWEEAIKKFKCPCHGSVFNDDGTVQNPPANKPLNSYKVDVKDGKLVFNPLQPFGV